MPRTDGIDGRTQDQDPVDPLCNFMKNLEDGIMKMLGDLPVKQESEMDEGNPSRT